jgi:protein TonB
MYYTQSSLKCFAIIIIAAIFAACNANNSADKISDTASMPAYSSTDTTATTPDTTTSATHAADTPAITMQPASTGTSGKNKTAGASSKKGHAVVKMLAPTPPKTHKIVMDKSGVYEYAEVMPSYPGGTTAIENYVTNRINYPQLALDDGKEGRVLIAFTVDENRKVTDAHSVSKKLGDGLDEEAVRVVSGMPGWAPGTVKGKPVNARMTLPITFQIEE